MSEHKTGRKPLLYIHQPAFNIPQANMQEKYSTRAVNELIDEAPAFHEVEVAEETTKAEANNETLDKEQVAKAVEEWMEPKEESTISEENESLEETDNGTNGSISPFTVKRRKHYSFNRVKSFKEMDTIEQLKYLERFPRQLPPVPCLFITEDTAYKGFYQSLEDELVIVKLYNEKLVEIQLSDLKEIKMAGHM